MLAVRLKFSPWQGEMQRGSSFKVADIFRMVKISLPIHRDRNDVPIVLGYKTNPSDRLERSDGQFSALDLNSAF
ncbi:hypothetical protein BFP97_05090 [Roseivirga sp. 4D4]|nr:hypothetical protein BFP97_05090 [Roseivirga sp. 4D4]